jgi:hypothetical protein
LICPAFGGTFRGMFNKLSIVNDCLGLTGNALCNAEEDGSDEWRVASIAYEAAILDLLAAHDWKFATAIQHMTRLGDSPDTEYQDEYAKPANSLSLIWVRVYGQDVDWKIVGNKVLVSAGDAPNGEVTAKIVLQPLPEQLHPLFVKALRSFVRAGIFGGLNEDHGEARREREEGEAYIQQAKTKSDQEQRARPVYRSTWLRTRSTRKAPMPW